MNNEVPDIIPQEVKPSTRSKTWRRFKRNKAAMVGLVVVVLQIIIAVLGYLITVDQTPKANDQVAEIADKRPGFKMKYLKIRKSKDVKEVNIFSKMLRGQENPYTLIPITDWHFDGNDVVIQHYVGDGISPIEERHKIWDVVYYRSLTDTAITVTGSNLAFTDNQGQKISTTADDLKQTVEKKNITTIKYFLGTDRSGRDILSRLMLSVRISLSVGLIAVIISLLIGVMLGAMAGYFRGFFDDLVLWIINTLWSIPTILLVFAISIAMGRGLMVIFIAVGLTMWIEVARVIRGQVLSLREMQYIEAARSLGYGHLRTIVRHILPNVIGPVMVIAASNFANAIQVEAGLSFLGIGVNEPTPSWGSMLQKNYGQLFTSNPTAAIFPGVAIAISVLAFYLVGNGLRDAFDVKTNLKSNT